MRFPDAISRRRFLASAATGLSFPLLVHAQDKKRERVAVEEAVERGLQWLKGAQNQAGYWEAQGGNYKTAMTGLAGMAFLMEGSTLKEGKYTDQVRKAVEWLIAPAQQQPTGLIADRRGSGFGNYMHGHGFALMFLASAYGDAEDGEENRKLEKAITKAVDFTCKVQSRRKHPLPEGKSVEIGGWTYTGSVDGNNGDEGSITITQLQALRAAKNAAIIVPKETIDKAVAYLDACTTPKGGVVYNYTGQAMAGQERPPITAAAVCCSFSAGQYKSESAKKWIKFCKDNIPIAKGRVAHDEYQNYYFAQVAYALGEDKYGEMFPNEPKGSWLTWSKYKEAMFPYLLEQQQKNGAWVGGYISPVFTSSVNLAILQLEKGLLPIYQR